jgi:hypothetical protein
MALKIGYPHDPVKRAKKKEQTLNDLLSSRARAWHGYFGTMSLAYEAAHKQHEATLKEIKESIKNQQAFIREMLFGAIIPAMIGGGMASLVSDMGKAIFPKLLGIAKSQKSLLVDFGAGAASTMVKDTVKKVLGQELNSLVAEPGSAWDAVGPSPLRFFLQLQTMVDNYTTDVTRSVENAKSVAGTTNDLELYIDTVNAHLLSPFIQNAPMRTDFLYRDDELAPIYEIFLWIVWARQRDVKYWSTRIYSATTTTWIDRDAGGYTDQREYSGAVYELEQLDPIRDRLQACGINTLPLTQAESLARNTSFRFLNPLWLRFLGAKHRGSLLSDLTDNLDAKVPKSALEDEPLNRSRRLK